MFAFIQERRYRYRSPEIIALKWNEQHENNSIFFNTIYSAINTPDARVGVCCSHKVVAVGFNTLRYDASVGVLNHPHE